jgi:hypothetical protein
MTGTLIRTALKVDLDTPASDQKGIHNRWHPECELHLLPGSSTNSAQYRLSPPLPPAKSSKLNALTVLGGVLATMTVQTMSKLAI